ncbi:lysophospholipid acyltransferase family protein [Xanthomarina spongicola]|uniref:1-acyl-sn-glycerol-3-phosphate acyltransferase n=1 Tax=Xanthomarina spongicola TaxID=570520 RepID=A0A316DL35_9FLAO|nr:lysophospholipid acyltransferase family protein [Xanthomarina spongicola]PWK17929.1 1-acyl-sn-glycerol-3-phosphate acyltransferase [Xanthomarina spongicola]
MKNIWLHTVRIYLRIGLFFYYKKIVVVKENQIPKNKPILFLSNHQNALIDALLIATTSGRFSYFLTRASVFKKSVVSKLLHSVNMLPVYRIRDGWSLISKNNYIFKTCTEKLKNNQAVALFPEGNHHINRTVRPLSKGFTRIIFESLNTYTDLDLQLVPIGINYQHGINFGDSVALYYGSPISARDMVSNFSSEEIVVLRQTMQEKIKNLTTHINNDVYNETITKLNALNVDYLNPKAVNRCIETNFQHCKTLPKQSKSWLKQFFKGLLIINLFLPFIIWKYYIKPKIKEVEFIATFRFAIAISLVPIWLLLCCFVLASNFGLIYGIAYVLSVLIITLLSVKL